MIIVNLFKLALYILLGIAQYRGDVAWWVTPAFILFTNDYFIRFRLPGHKEPSDDTYYFALDELLGDRIKKLPAPKDPKWN